MRSVRSMVMAPASTGRDNSRRMAVMSTAHGNMGIRSSRTPGERRFSRVLMKLIAPRMEEIPARWREKIARSTAGPEWDRLEERGG